MSNIYRCGNCGGDIFKLIDEEDEEGSIEVWCLTNLLKCTAKSRIVVSPSRINIDWIQDSPGVIVTSRSWGR